MRLDSLSMGNYLFSENLIYIREFPYIVTVIHTIVTIYIYVSSISYYDFPVVYDSS